MRTILASVTIITALAGGIALTVGYLAIGFACLAGGFACLTCLVQRKKTS